MAENIFILGAGASFSSGAPLMATFLDVAKRLFDSHELDEITDECLLIFRAMAEMQRAAFKSQMDFRNLEAVFAAFEMSKLLGRLGSLAPSEIERLPSAMTRLIEATLEKTVRYPFHTGVEGDYRASPDPGYRTLADLARRIIEKNGIDSASIITFNYDACMDFALERVFKCILCG